MASNRITHALVRPPGDSFVNAISSRRIPIDVPLAQAEHQEYCKALTAAGLDLQLLPSDERYPDSCFVEDPAILVGGMAVIARLSAPSRAGEETAIAEWLAERFSLARINAPGTLEGGDVLLLPGRVLVGASGRTNSFGIDQLVEILAPVGLAVSSLPVISYLHLLTAVSFLGQNTLLTTADFAGHPAFLGFDAIVVPPEESYAANALALGDYVVIPAGCPRVAAMLRARGFSVLLVPLSQFEAADGGVTCLSLVW